MRSRHWPLELTGILISMSLPSHAVQLWPYQDGMVVGAGFNSFDGQVKLHSAISVPSNIVKARRSTQPPGNATDYEDGFLTEEQLIALTPDGMSASAPQVERADANNQKRNEAPVGHRDYSAIEISNYGQLLQTLSAEGSASIKRWGALASVSGGYTDKESFESSAFTFLVRINVQKQVEPLGRLTFLRERGIPENELAMRYGDRYIQGFIRGGAFYARVSIHIQGGVMRKDVRAAAKAVIGSFGVSGEIKASSEHERVLKNTSIEINKITLGKLASSGQQNPVKTDGGNVLSALADLKAEADRFYQEASEQDAKLYAVLDEYENLHGFYSDTGKKAFQPLEYKPKARKKAQNLLSEYATFDSSLKLIESKDNFSNASSKNILQNQIYGFSQRIVEWVDNVSANPLRYNEDPNSVTAESFRTTIAYSLKPKEVQYEAYKITEAGGYQYDSTPPENYESREWHITVYEAPVKDTIRIVSGTLNGRRVWRMNKRLPPNFEKETEFWAYDFGNKDDASVLVPNEYDSDDRYIALDTARGGDRHKSQDRRRFYPLRYTRRERHVFGSDDVLEGVRIPTLVPSADIRFCLSPGFRARLGRAFNESRDAEIDSLTRACFGDGDRDAIKTWAV